MIIYYLSLTNGSILIVIVISDINGEKASPKAITTTKTTKTKTIIETKQVANNQKVIPSLSPSISPSPSPIPAKQIKVYVYLYFLIYFFSFLSLLFSHTARFYITLFYFIIIHLIRVRHEFAAKFNFDKINANFHPEISLPLIFSAI